MSENLDQNHVDQPPTGSVGNDGRAAVAIGLITLAIIIFVVIALV